MLCGSRSAGRIRFHLYKSSGKLLILFCSHFQAWALTFYNVCHTETGVRWTSTSSTTTSIGGFDEWLELEDLLKMVRLNNNKNPKHNKKELFFICPIFSGVHICKLFYASVRARKELSHALKKRSWVSHIPGAGTAKRTTE